GVAAHRFTPHVVAPRRGRHLDAVNLHGRPGTRGGGGGRAHGVDDRSAVEAPGPAGPGVHAIPLACAGEIADTGGAVRTPSRRPFSRPGRRAERSDRMIRRNLIPFVTVVVLSAGASAGDYGIRVFRDRDE